MDIEIDPAAMEIAAPFVNQFQFVIAGDNLRISFAEGFAGERSNYRSAVVMSLDDAMSLAMMVLNIVPLDVQQKWYTYDPDDPSRAWLHRTAEDAPASRAG